MNQEDVFVQHYEVCCAPGIDKNHVAEAMFADRCSSVPIKRVEFPLQACAVDAEDSRNNRLLTTTTMPLCDSIAELKRTYGSHRVGVVLGTSTSGISDGEDALAYRHAHGQFPENYHYNKQEMVAPARYLAAWLGLKGPCYGISSACTSGAKALISAARLIRTGACDAVVAGGVDTLCEMTLQGFSALQVVADQRSNPFSINRCGINLGEGAAVFVLSRTPSDLMFAGYGESSDAHHFSSPHPTGLGARLAMQRALKRAGLEPTVVDYLNLHGTGTIQNDQMEALAIAETFDHPLVMSSTKPLTGHTLGAAGAVEAAICCLALQRGDGRVPTHHWDAQRDPKMPELPGLAVNQLGSPMSTAMSNSFAFGGSNASLIFSRIEHG